MSDPSHFLIPMLAGLLIIAANAFFVAVEYALVASNQLRLRQAAESGSRSAQRVLAMLEDPDKAIAAVQLGVTVASILLGVVAEEPLLRLLEPLLEPLFGVFFEPIVATAFAGLIALLLLSYFLMVFGELTPKMLVLRAPERVAQLFIYPMWLFARLTAPFVWVVDASTGLVLRLLGVRDARVGHGVVASLDELRLVLEQSREEGIIEEEAQEMLERVFDFGERIVREVMVPRTEILGVDKNATVADLMRLFRDHPYSRFPVYENDLDHIVGVIVIKDVMRLLVDAPELMEARVGDLPVIRPPLMTPETRHVDDLFEEMRAKDIGLAIVIDEFGGTAGIVTREALVEEIVGAMFDEWERRPQVRRIGAAVEVDARMRVADANELLDLDLPEEDAYETLAGLILHRLRRLPDPGERLQVGDWLLEVTSMEGPRIARVRIQRATEPS
jgi:CBS domain containing-hemolysin-like protein